MPPQHRLPPFWRSDTFPVGTQRSVWKFQGFCWGYATFSACLYMSISTFTPTDIAAYVDGCNVPARTSALSFVNVSTNRATGRVSAHRSGMPSPLKAFAVLSFPG